MKLLEFTQLANNTLGIVETGRNLVTRPQGNGSVAALSQQIDTVGAALSSEIRGTRDVLQRDIGTVTSMVSQVSAQQVVLRQEIHQVIEGVSSLNVLMKKHMHTVEDQLRFLIDEPLQNACYQLTAHLTNKEGVGATDEEIRGWLRILESWISKAGIRKTMTMSSEDAAQLLSQSPDNIGFIASRLHLLFGNIIPDKFLSLPPVSIKFYFTVITLYLKGLEKNPHLLGSDKAASICQEIQNTLNVYLEFSNFVKQHAELIQALFDQYNRFRDKVGRILFSTNQYNVSELIKSPALFEMEERRLLLTTLTNLTCENHNSALYQKVSELESMSHIVDVASWPVSRRKEYVETKCFGYPVADYRIKLQYGLLPLTQDVWSSLVSQNQHQAAVDCFYLNLSQDLSSHEHKFKVSKKPEFDLVGSAPVPKPSTFVVGWSPGGDNWSNLETHSLDDRSYQAVVDQCSYALPSDQRYVVTAPMLLLYFCADCGLYAGNLFHLTTWGYFQTFYGTLNSQWHISGSASNDYKNRYVKSINGEVFTQHTIEYGLSRMPTEARAMAKHLAYEDQKIYELLLQFHILITKGCRDEALALLKKQNFDAPYKAGYLLFLVSILGHWEAWEAFSKQYPSISDNYNWTMKDGSWTPLMLAALHGRYDVIVGLTANSTINVLVRCAAESGKPARTAAEIALDEGYFSISEYLIRKQPNRENDLSAAAKLRYAELKSNWLLHKEETGFTEVRALHAQRRATLLLRSTAAPSSDYEKSLTEIRSRVLVSKTKLGQYVPPPPAQQAALAAQAANPLPDEVTDDEMEVALEKTTREFFSEHNRHAGRASFWKKPIERQHNRMGFRVINDSEFETDDQRNLFFGRLDKKEFRVLRQKTEKRLLVKLPPMEP